MRAALDIGTNTVRLVIGTVRQGQVEPVGYSRQITRLGGHFDEASGLAPESMERTLSALKEMAREIRRHSVKQVSVVGTAAFRKASNGAEFAERIRTETGLPLRIIDGNEEARLTMAGIFSVVSPPPEASLAIDIGGGSTEFVTAHLGKLTWVESFPLGVVELCETVPEPDWQKFIDQCLDKVQTVLASLPDHPAPAEWALVGTAGTVTTLAALAMEMTDYDWRKVNNYCLSISKLQELETRLKPLTPCQRESLPGMERGRGDLILPGLRIILSIMTRCHFQTLRVSDFGLLEGQLLTLTDVSG